jgi:hypothetical protein
MRNSTSSTNLLVAAVLIVCANNRCICCDCTATGLHFVITFLILNNSALKVVASTSKCSSSKCSSSYTNTLF